MHRLNGKYSEQVPLFVLLIFYFVSGFGVVGGLGFFFGGRGSLFFSSVPSLYSTLQMDTYHTVVTFLTFIVCMSVCVRVACVHKCFPPNQRNKDTS